MTTQFPQLPKYGFSWRSIQIEPIPHSDERITVGSIVKGEDSALIAAKLLTGQKLKSVYGQEFGKRIADALNLCVDAAEKYFSNHSLSSNWIPPLEGFHIGKEKFSHADSIEDGLLVSALHCSSFSLALESGKIDGSNDNEVSAPENWRRRITESVKLTRSDLEHCFQRKILIRGSGVPFKFDFVSEKYAAHFDAISRSGNFQQALVRAQSKLWQLDRLRDEGNLFKPDFCELLLETPEKNSERANEVSDFVGELLYEASKREIGLFASDSSLDAAEHLIKNAA